MSAHHLYSFYLIDQNISLAHHIGATGLYIDKKIVICGGYMGWQNTTNMCYHMKQGNYPFDIVYQMNESRYSGKSILLQGYMLVSGGWNPDEGLESSDTAEYINHLLDNSTAPKPVIQLPRPTFEHSFIKINKSTVFLVGGQGDPNFPKSRQTHYLNIFSNEWKSGPELKIGRSHHAAGVLIDHATNTQIVAVVGGSLEGMGVTDSVELLAHGQNEWTEGIFIHHLHGIHIKIDFFHCFM